MASASRAESGPPKRSNYFGNRLYWRLSTGFLSLFWVFTGLMLVSIVLIWDKIAAESNQRLHWNLAQVYAKELSPLLKIPIDSIAIAEWTYRFGEHHPDKQVFLVYLDGRVSPYSTFLGGNENYTIDVKPIQKLLTSSTTSGELPIYGESPTTSERKAVFSASKIQIGDEAGYLYIVLQSTKQSNLIQTLGASSVLQGFIVAGVLSILVLSALALALIWFLTQRLYRLRDSLIEIKHGDWEQRVEISGKDEIAELANIVNEMAATIAENIEQLKQKDLDRKELVANISHDLRGPLTSIKGYSETLYDNAAKLSEEMKAEFHSGLLHNVDYLSKLLSSLSELSELDAKNVAISPQPVELEEFFDSMRAKFLGRMNEAGISFNLHLADPTSTALADRKALERIISNLIENAYVHTSKGESIVLSATEKNGSITLAVSDTGMGIPAAVLEQIFERFYRGDQERSKNRGGAGLGLSIVKGLLELHGSKIEVESTEGKGSTFYFSLKAA